MPGAPTIPMIPHIGYHASLENEGLRIFHAALLLLPHGPITLTPPKLPQSRSATISATGALSFLFVVGMAPASTTAYVSRLLPFTHTRRAF